MVKQLQTKTELKPRILVVSQRGLRHQVANSCLYEFEDFISDIDRVDLFVPTSEFPLYRKIHRTVKYISRSKKVANTFAPIPHKLVLKQEYDLLFLVADSPWQIAHLDAIAGWRDKCKFVACYIAEIWDKDLENWRLWQESFNCFDRIFLGVSHCTTQMSQIVGYPCTYLPPAVDTLLFSPRSSSPFDKRSIDVCYVGRRLPKIHRALLELASKQDFFYYYDTAKKESLEVERPQEHRFLLANLLKRSRYTITNYAKINLGEETSGKQEIGYRFFEGAAAGTVMLGMPPAIDTFQQYFDWSDAVVEVDFRQENIIDVIERLNSQPELLARISCNNIINSLQKHDWLYRWQHILEVFNLPLTKAMTTRKLALQQSVDSLRKLTISC